MHAHRDFTMQKTASDFWKTSYLILTVNYARWSIWMTINQGSGVSKKSGIIRKVLSSQGFAIFQPSLFLSEETYEAPKWHVCPIYSTRTRVAWHRCIDEGWTKSSYKWLHHEGSRAAMGQHKDVISPRAAFEVGVLKLGESPGNCLVSGDQRQEGTASCWAGWPGAGKVQGLAVRCVCILYQQMLSIREKNPVLKGHGLASHP